MVYILMCTKEQMRITGLEYSLFKVFHWKSLCGQDSVFFAESCDPLETSLQVRIGYQVL